jgi:hypothetical protein
MNYKSLIHNALLHNCRANIDLSWENLESFVGKSGKFCGKIWKEYWGDLERLLVKSAKFCWVGVCWNVVPGGTNHGVGFLCAFAYFNYP